MKDSSTASRNKMFVALHLLFCIWLLKAVYGAITTIDCTGKKGEVQARRSWSCGGNGTVECRTVREDCSDCHSNVGNAVYGRRNYAIDGQITEVGEGGWDCRANCERDDFSGGTSSLENSDCSSTIRDSIIIDECQHKCVFGGGCEMRYIGSKFQRLVKGSCFSLKYGGSCRGRPDMCKQNCNDVLKCH